MMNLKSALNHIYPVDEKLLDQYLALWTSQTFDSKEFLLLQGNTEKHLNFINKGLVKSYKEKNGKEHVIAFAYDGSFCSDPRSWFLKSPSDIYIQCITPVQLTRISIEVHERFIENHIEMERLFRKASEHLLIGFMDRYEELMTLSIEDRFKSFARRSPQLLNLIPHKDLASYLRIDATNFSKLYNSTRV